MHTYLFTYSIALLLATALTPIVIYCARRLNLVDHPDARKIHKTPTARIGGIAIYIATMLAIFPVILINNKLGYAFRAKSVELLALFIASSLIFVVGFYDDLKQARIRTKLFAQFTAALIVLIAGLHIDRIVIRDLVTIQLGWFGYVVTFIWIIGVTNAVNLIDGLDGLAAGISAIACGVIAFVSILQGNLVLGVIMLSIFGSLTGFLFFNFHPAKIFMGDCGSLFLGFTIAASSVMTAAKAEALVGIGLPILVLGVPIFDTLLSMFRRFLNRRGLMSPDRGHFHHCLIDKGLKQNQVAVFAYAVTAILSGFGLFMMLTRSTLSVILFLSCLALILLVFRLVGSVELHRSLDGIRQRAALNQKQRVERKNFEEAQLQLHQAHTFDQWWMCVCKAAYALEFSKLCLEIENGGPEKEQHRWSRQKKEQEQMDLLLEDILEVKIPIASLRNSKSGSIKIQVKKNGSLESAGRRIALFTRLAEEFTPGALEENTQ